MNGPNGLRVWILIIVLCCITPEALTAQQGLLQSGPMAGYSEMREAALWVQTTEPAAVKFVYWDSAATATRYETVTDTTRSLYAHTATLIADRVQPGKTYYYELYINSILTKVPHPLKFRTQELWHWRSDPPAVRFALGSCAYVNDPVYDRPGNSYGGDYKIFTSILEKQPEFMIWLGDNVYLREADWFTRTGIFYRYTHSRSLKEIQPLLGSAHHYAIWDDHDFGPNNADRSFREKATALEAFRSFWPNPSYGIDGEPGITTNFTWADIDFFLLDNRYYRNANNRATGERAMLGNRQIEWLIDALKSSKAPFKLIVSGGQTLNPIEVNENYAIFAQERERLLQRIAAEDIPGVMFISGDRHFSELTKLDRPDTYPLYEITVSPLTSGAVDPERVEENPARVPETLVTERNFAIVDISGPRKNRKLKCTIYDKNGKPLWSRSIAAGRLR